MIILYVYTGITLLSVVLAEPGVSIGSGIVEHEEAGVEFAEPGELTESGKVEHEE